MSDGTEALETAADTQPVGDGQVEGLEQAEGATDAPQQGVEPAMPDYLEPKLREALGKLPEDQREAFLRLGDDLPLAREVILKGVDYHAKRQKESAELREIKARMAEFEQDAQYWRAAQADPARAAQMFMAASGHQPQQAQETPAQKAVDLEDLLMETDPDRLRELKTQYEQGLESRLLEKLRSEMSNTPQARDSALRQRFSQIQQRSGLADGQMKAVLEAAQAELDARGMSYTDLDPNAFELLLAPSIRLAKLQSAPQSNGLNPTALSGSQAASLRGSGPSNSRPVTRKPGAEASTEERLAWTMKARGLSSLQELFGHGQT